jgi:hypothetical protein
VNTSSSQTDNEGGVCSEANTSENLFGKVGGVLMGADEAPDVEKRSGV